MLIKALGNCSYLIQYSKKINMLPEGQEEIKEELESTKDKQLIKNALIDYQKLSAQDTKGFKVFRISNTGKHEMSKSAIVGDFQENVSKRKKFEQSFNYDKSRVNKLPGFKVNFSLNDLIQGDKEHRSFKKKKTKEALRRYKEINHMLERIQREANKLNSEYEKRKNSDI